MLKPLPALSASVALCALAIGLPGFPIASRADAPPLFAAIAADDPLFGKANFALIDSWRTAGRPVEFHLYEQGGHGFGMYPKATTSTGWFDAFARWMTMHGWMRTQ